MKKINDQQLKQLVEAAIFVADEPVSVDTLKTTVLESFKVTKKQINKVLDELVLDYAPRGIRLCKLASGFRFQSDPSLGQQLSKLWQENAPKYSRAMLETLALIAYKQPITRGEIEDVRGVTVSSHIIKSLTEREWIKVVGHKEVPGRPALLATTQTFLDYFGLASLSELPSADLFNSDVQWSQPSNFALDIVEENTVDENIIDEDAVHDDITKENVDEKEEQQTGSLH